MWFMCKYTRTCIYKSLKLTKSLSTCNPEWKVLFFGTDDFSLSHLITLHKMQSSHMISNLAVVVSDEKCPINKYAKKAEIKSFKWPLSEVPDYNIGVVVSFGHLIQQSVIKQFQHGMINVHPSLLPRWRGAAPIEHTILSGDSKTGVSIMKIEPKFDCGPVLLQQVVPIPLNMDGKELRKNLALVGSELLLNVLQNWQSVSRNSTKQDANLATFARKVNVVHAKINWENTMDQIDRQYRAFGQTFNLRSVYKDKVVRLLDMTNIFDMKNQIIPEIEESLDNDDSVLPGYPLYLNSKELLCIKCKDGWVGFNSVVIKKTMTAKAFNNGYISKEENKHLLFTSINNELNKFSHWTSNSSM